MRVLGLETAADTGGVGLIDDEGWQAEMAVAAPSDHGAKLTGAVDAVLRLAGAGRDDLDLIAVAQGPGSFTGLRVGLAFARGLAQALELPVIGVPTLAAYAERASFWPGPVWALVPDRRHSVYRAVEAEGRWTREPAAVALEGLLPELRADGRSQRPLCVGPGAARHAEQLARECPEAVIGSEDLHRPSGAAIARLGRRRYAAEGAPARGSLEPLYLQSPPAEPPSKARPV